MNFQRQKKRILFLKMFFIGVYGDVHRVKILFNKKDSALIQFATPQQAAVGKYQVFFLIRLTYIFIYIISSSKS
jgi:hypothetical protein